MNIFMNSDMKEIKDSSKIEKALDLNKNKGFFY